MYKILVTVFCLLASPFSFAVEKADFVKFFDEYQRLSLEFDPLLNKMYADDAKVMGARKKSDGTEETMTIDGARWKTIIVGSMENAKQLGDSSKYSNVAIELVEGSPSRAKITATRYAELNCFTDGRFYIVVENTANNELKIVEQFMESAARSECGDLDLPKFLQTTTEMINKQLPADIDDQTRLIKTTAEGTKLTYHYILINHTLETLSAADATAKLKPVVEQQSCGSPNLRPILDQDGSLSYIYKGADAVQIVRFDVDKSICEG